MAQFELPTSWRGGRGVRNLTVEAYSDRYSSYWNSNVVYDEFLEVCDHYVPYEADALLEARDEFLEGSFEDVLEREPANPEFFVVYGPDYSLSWEKTPENEFYSEVGVSAEEPQLDLIEELYNRLENDELPDEAMDDIHRLLMENVTG